MADYGVLFLGLVFMNRKDGDGNYLTPVRHAVDSVSFGTELTTITAYMDKYSNLSSDTSLGTGYDTMLWWHFVLMGMCTVNRLGGIFDGTYDLFTMQCYDNFVADIYLEQQEGMYAELDVFTWKGMAIAYAFMTINNGLDTIASSLMSYFIIYFFYLIKIGSLKYGDFQLMLPVYDYGWFGDSIVASL